MLFRHTTRAGKEAVRAYVYLETLKKGVSSHEANILTDAMLSDIGSATAINAANMAKMEYGTVHGGKQLPMIGYAYRQGLRSIMPFWYQKMTLAAPETLGIEVSYGRLQPERALPENVQRLGTMVTDEGYKSFCATFCHEVNRISGEQHYEQKEGGVWKTKPCTAFIREARMYGWRRPGTAMSKASTERCSRPTKATAWPLQPNWRDCLQTVAIQPTRTTCFPGWIAQSCTQVSRPTLIPDLPLPAITNLSASRNAREDRDSIRHGRHCGLPYHRHCQCAVTG